MAHWDDGVESVLEPDESQQRGRYLEKWLKHHHNLTIKQGDKDRVRLVAREGNNPFVWQSFRKNPMEELMWMEERAISPRSVAWTKVEVLAMRERVTFPRFDVRGDVACWVCWGGTYDYQFADSADGL